MRYSACHYCFRLRLDLQYIEHSLYSWVAQSLELSPVDYKQGHGWILGTVNLEYKVTLLGCTGPAVTTGN